MTGYAVLELVLVPALPITILAGIAFGPVWGTLYAWIGATGSEALAFLIARHGARAIVESCVAKSRRLSQIDTAVARHGWRILAFTRLVPVFPFNMQNYAYGLTGIHFSTYLVVSAIFSLPGTVALVIAGDALVEGDADLRWLVVYLGIAALLLGLLSVVPTRLGRGSASRTRSPGGSAPMSDKGRWWGTLGLILILGAVTPAWTASEEILLLGRLGSPTNPDGLPEGWQPLIFQNIPMRTRYSIVRDGGGYVLKAHSRAAASGLYRPVDVDPRAYQTIAWRWKVENIFAKGDARRKEGDDYPARAYVAFRYDPDTATLWEKTRYGAYKLFYGEYPPQGVINYIWDNRLPRGTALDNAFTDRAKMIVVRSGAEDVGRWLAEERNLNEDYRRLFGQEPPRIAGVAVMTDTDNTGESAVAYYDQIILRPAK